jgi:hypothetical protein
LFQIIRIQSIRLPIIFAADNVDDDFVSDITLLLPVCQDKKQVHLYALFSVLELYLYDSGG